MASFVTYIISTISIHINYTCAHIGIPTVVFMNVCARVRASVSD